MSKFLNHLIVVDMSTEAGRRFMLAEALVYESQLLAGTVTVPKGFTTDFASIPRFLWRIFPPAGASYDSAAVVHDMLYRVQFTTKAKADAVFSEAMKVKGVPGWKRWIIITGLKIGGWMVWRGYTKRLMEHKGKPKIKPSKPA